MCVCVCIHMEDDDDDFVKDNGKKYIAAVRRRIHTSRITLPQSTNEKMKK